MRAIGGRIALATHNPGKRDEISALLEPLGLDVLSAADLGLPEPPETEDSFAGNARIKAHSAARISGLPALSDDSGLSVAALDGAPGVQTADWAEIDSGRDFDMAMRRLWSELLACGAAQPWRAQFHCTLCLAWPDGEDMIFTGTVLGRIVWPMRGMRGFGFDPVFLPDGETITFGEMDPARKHAMSHRSIAFALFLRALERG